MHSQQTQKNIASKITISQILILRLQIYLFFYLETKDLIVDLLISLIVAAFAEDGLLQLGDVVIQKIRKIRRLVEQRNWDSLGFVMENDQGFGLF